MKMKIKLNRVLGITMIASALTVSLDSCIKNHLVNETEFSNLQDHVVLLNAGLGFVSASNVNFKSDTATVTITANLTSVNPNTSPLVVTIATDAAQIASYNASHNTAFVALPDSAFTLASTSITIPAGSQYGTTTISFYKSKIDPTTSYMMPISIKDASGKTLSSNENTRFFNIIGNPIAGDYEQYFSRWLAPDSTGGSATANYYNADFGTVSFGATSPTRIEAVSAAFGETDIISFTNTNNVLSDFKVAFPDGEAARQGLLTYGPPVFEVADPVKGIYKVVYTYTNAVGVRLCVNTFVRQ